MFAYTIEIVAQNDLKIYINALLYLTIVFKYLYRVLIT